MNWTDAATQIKAWQSANPNQTKCMLITAAEISSINAQSTGICALKIYLGQDANGNVTGFFIGCVDDGNGGYNDFNIPLNQSGWNTALSANLLPVKKDAKPCPVWCGTSNYLNS